jgi:glycosyltransferase involved in cell wall biosynthesis
VTADLRVGLDARFLSYAGIGRFVQELWTAHLDIGTDLVAWTRAGHRSDFFASAGFAAANGSGVNFPARPYNPAEQVVYPLLLRRHHVRVEHATHLSVPLTTRTPVVLTVHDIEPVRDRTQNRSPAASAFFRVAFPAAIRRAQIIVAVSDCVRQEIETRFRPRAPVTVIRHGVNAARWRPAPAEEVEALRRELGLPARFLLYVGTAKPRKNLVQLDLVLRQDPSLPPLVIVGATSAELLARGLFHGIADRVRVLGRIADNRLRLLYAGASVLLVPSRHEGSGLPVLEAMACGCPVIASTGGALGETVAGAGALVDPDDTEAWLAEISALLAEHRLRTQRIDAGLARAAACTWTAAAHSYRDLYAQVAGAG